MIGVDELHMHFGGIRAVDGVSLAIERGTVTGLIGPNGAGKTTLFNVIAGLYAPTSGRVYLDGEDITGLKPHQLFQKGLLRTFQIAHEFSTLTVRENLMMVPGRQSGERLIDTWLRPAKVWAEEKAIRFGQILERSFNEIYVFNAETLKFIQVNEGARRNLGYAMPVH